MIPQLQTHDPRVVRAAAFLAGRHAWNSRPSGSHPVVAKAKEKFLGPFSSPDDQGTLAPDVAMLSRVKANAGALYFYNCYPDQGGNLGNGAFAYFTVFLLEAMRIVEADVPLTLGVAKSRSYYNALKENFDKWQARNRSLASLVSAKRTRDGYEVVIPVFSLSSEHAATLFARALGRASGNETAPYLERLNEYARGERTWQIATRALSDYTRENPYVHKAMYSQLQALPQGQMTMARAGSMVVVSLRLLFTKPECEALCQTEWAKIRPTDFFMLMQSWAKADHGTKGSQYLPPRCSRPLQHIANTRPSAGKPRTDANGICIDPNSEFWWLPPELDSIGAYDADAARAYTRQDGRMCALTEEGKLDAPRPGPIFLDWLNLKFAYANLEGFVSVNDLSRVLPITPVHVRVLFERKLIENPYFNDLWNVGDKLGLPNGGPLLNLLGRKGRGLASAVVLDKRKAGDYEVKEEDITIADAMAARSVPGSMVERAFGPGNDLAQLMAAIFAELSQPGKLEAMYPRVSTAAIHRAYAVSLLLTKHANNYDTEVVPQAREALAIYREQGLDKDFTPESIPFVRNPAFLMPHQARCMNMLRNSPKLAILSVQAGGGKTILAISDFLKELKNGNVKRGLIMCPPHLVAQYVKEFVYYTDGRVNVIAVTSYTIDTHGMDGLAKMLESAPANSVVVTDYNLANGGKKSMSVGFGGANVPWQPVVEMLRAFRFDWVFCDESHLLKNGDSNRTRSVSRLLTEIPYKRIASGTLMPNTVLDLVEQVKIMDPTIFGTEEEFYKRYAENGSGNGKRTKWREGFQEDLMYDLKQRTCYVTAQRKEWAALLPDMIETAPADLELTPKQRQVYDVLVNQVVEQISHMMAKKSEKSKQLKGLLTKSGDEEEDDDSGNKKKNSATEDMDDLSIENLMRQSTQALEEFLTNPVSHPLGNATLEGDDRISPKVHAIARIMREHIAERRAGKILIFVNYIDSAKHIYDNLPSDLRKMCIHYVAADKVAAVAQFDRDPTKIAMVGVEVSMNTGLNLQVASHLIRADSVWTPGSLEQGNSRIQRPNPKAVENRDVIRLTWLLVNRTLDITKSIFLFTKRVSIGMVENAGNPLFSSVPVLPLFPMTLDVIAACNTTDSSELAPYFQAYEQYQNAVNKDYRDYRNDHPEDLEEDGRHMKKIPVQRAPNLPDSKLMYRIPYVPGTELYSEDKLGLQRFDAFLRLNVPLVDDDDEDDDGATESKSARQESAELLAKIVGQEVHTEYGDGQVVGVTKKALVILMGDGTKVRVAKMACFFITRKQTNNADMRYRLLKEIGDVPFDKPDVVTVPDADEVVIPRKRKVKPLEDEGDDFADRRLPVALSLSVTNDHLVLEMVNSGENTDAAMILQARGFREPAAYMYAKLPTAKHMYDQMHLWHKSGLKIEPGFSAACRDMYFAMQTKRKGAVNLYGLATEAQIKNWFRLVVKPQRNPSVICPYPMAFDNDMYLCLPVTGHPGTAVAMKHRAPGVKWFAADTENTLQYFLPTPQALDQLLAEFEDDPDLVITTLRDLQKARKALQKRNPQMWEEKLKQRRKDAPEPKPVKQIKPVAPVKPVKQVKPVAPTPKGKWPPPKTAPKQAPKPPKRAPKRNDPDDDDFDFDLT